MLLGSYHIFEWVRFIVLMVAVFLGTNVVSLYYVLYLNTLFGLVTYIIVMADRFGNENCADSQPGRMQVLTAEVIIFFVTFVIMSFPQLILLCMSQKNKDEAWEGPKEDEEEEGDPKAD